VPNPETIQAGKVVSFHYTLTDDAGKVLDTSSGGRPMDYLHGAENIVPGLEREMEGHTVGDKLKAVVDPESGYGKRIATDPQPIPRDAFPDEVELRPGMQFAAEGPDGDLIPLWIAKVEPEQVFVDPNHPLAGVTLHFAVEITGIRDATEEEHDHGHPHGPEGHVHTH
jgi:FKBP-type peptidyl-prolyl cis-trans isomerase SlyD